jgi:hypothetical protein
MDGHRHAKHQSVVVIFTLAVLICQNQVLTVGSVAPPVALQTASEPTTSYIPALSIISQESTRLSEVECLRVVLAAIHSCGSFGRNTFIRTVLALFDLDVGHFGLKRIIFVYDFPCVFRLCVDDLKIYYLLAVPHVLAHNTAVILACLQRFIFERVESRSLDSVLKKTRLSQLLRMLAVCMKA